MTSRQRANIKRREGEEGVETGATLGASGLEEGRVAGFFLQGKKVISTGFTPRQVFLN